MDHLKSKVRIVRRRNGVIRVYRLDDAGELTARSRDIGITSPSIAKAIADLCREFDWTVADWKLSNVSLSAESGFSVDVVRRKRLLLAPRDAKLGASSRLSSSLYPGTDWRVDAWTLSKQLGISYFIAKRLRAEGLGNRRSL